MYDYEELVKLIPELSNYIKDGKLDYTSSTAVRLLNKALLLKEFNLNVNLPEGHLCPTIPNRTGYIKQIETLLYNIFKIPSDAEVIGIDIGTGASCVYPLIGCSRNRNWTFFATEIDDEIIQFAQNNVDANMKDRIKIIKNEDPLQIFPASLVTNISSKSAAAQFIVCNPPFYSDNEDLETRRAFKRHKPVSDGCEMSVSELGTELGGEIGFIKKMIDESINLKTTVRLFTCMLGMKESLLELSSYLRGVKDVKSFAYELLQIKHTCRYLLFWSFTDEIPKDSSSDRLKITAKTKRTQIINVPDEAFDFEQFTLGLSKYGQLSEMKSEYGQVNDDFVLELNQNKWSRKYRRLPESAPLLPHPLSISVTFHNYCNLEFTLLDDDNEADWEIFLGFINHLRKEYQQNKQN